MHINPLRFGKITQQDLDSRDWIYYVRPEGGFNRYPALKGSMLITKPEDLGSDVPIPPEGLVMLKENSYNGDVVFLDNARCFATEDEAARNTILASPNHPADAGIVFETLSRRTSTGSQNQPRKFEWLRNIFSWLKRN